MFASPSWNRIIRLIWAFGLLAALLLTGCVTTTTTTVETTMHSPDPSFRFQSCDVTARVQVQLTR